VTPKMVMKFLTKDHGISLVECFTQFYFFLFQCIHRVLSPGSDGLWPLCCHM
jgi:hypothetical protein